MSTLQASLAQRRIDQAGNTTTVAVPASRPVFSVSNQTSTITFRTWNAGVWILPWFHFLSAHHSVGEDSERILFLFADHEVEVTGLHLFPLMADIAAMRLELLCELPERFTLGSTSSEPSIRLMVIKIQTESRTEAQEYVTENKKL
ncbi:hypothetical protein Ga0100231_019015 [Opitutaceae bacterium TAV4]|nr:hypothetical protein Ga0100231_019015 [Opitutaceae bacterium TAV4]RRK00187.1 hypothetical protein Ga0100230_019680 [Opitutaceae bacterium TAV3]RRK02002.1 hypothetical protein Ga0100230_001950 [Opitutaceae bacterium TAV3]